MATYKTESHKTSNSMKNKSDRMSYSLKNKVKSSKSDYASDNLLDLNMSIDNINDRTDTIIKASEKITNKQISDTARFYKESAKAFDDYITQVGRTSSKSNNFFSPNSSNGAKTGASSTSTVTPSYSGRSLFSDTSVASLSTKFSKSLDNHAKSFEKSSKFLKESLTGLTAAVAGFATYTSTQVLNRYNSYAQLTGSKEQTQSLYDTFARSNKELVNELNSTGHNTVSVDEFSKMNSMVAQYFKTDQKMIGDMSKSMVLASEAGMSVNSEFLRTSAYIYKQSGKNEKSIRKMTDQVYDTATKSNGVSLSDVQSMMMDSAKLSQSLAGQASQKGIKFDADKFVASDTKAKSALKEVSSQYGDEAYSAYNKIENVLAKEIITDPKDIQLLSAAGIDYGEGRKRLLSGDTTLSDDIVRGLKKASKLKVGQQEALFQNSNLTAAFGTTSDEELESVLKRQNSGKRTTKDAITSRKADWISSISNSFKEASIDTLPPMVAQATQYLGTIAGVVSSMGFLNLIGGGRGGLGAVKSGFSALSKSGIGRKGASFLSGSGKVGGLLKGVGGKALGVAGVGFTAYDAFNGATSDADRRFGKDANLGNRASSMLGSALGGSGEGGLGSALSGAGKGAAIGAFLGPVGAAVGAGIGGIFGAIGGDKIAKTFNDNIVDPLGKVGNSLKDNGKDLVSSVGDLAGGIFRNGGDLIKGLGDTLGEIPLIGGALKGVTDLAGGLANGIGDAISGTGNWLQSKLDGVVNFFTGNKSDKVKDGSEGKGGLPAFSGAPGHQVSGGDPSGPKPWTITATYGPNGYGPGNPHSGIDYGVPRGTNIVSTTGGTVYDTVANDGSNWRAYGSDGPGQGVIVQGDDGLLHMYWHLSKIGVTKGQKIKKGNSVGLSGNTGMSTGPHLHYEVDKDAPYLPHDINPSASAAGLWGASTSSPTSSDSTEEKVETNVITLSDSRRAKLSYAGSPGAGIRSRLGARGVGVGALPPTSNVSFNSDNTDVVSALRSTVSQLSNKLDMIADILIQTAPKDKTDDFRLTT